jgi:hypothetical protein
MEIIISVRQVRKGGPGTPPRFGKFYSWARGSWTGRAKPLNPKRIVALARTLQLTCQNKAQRASMETIMNPSANNESAHHLIPLLRINRSVLLGVCLIALTAVLFYGPVLLFVWRELR